MASHISIPWYSYHLVKIVNFRHIDTTWYEFEYFRPNTRTTMVYEFQKKSNTHTRWVCLKSNTGPLPVQTSKPIGFSISPSLQFAASLRFRIYVSYLHQKLSIVSSAKLFLVAILVRLWWHRRTWSASIQPLHQFFGDGTAPSTLRTDGDLWPQSAVNGWKGWTNTSGPET